MLLVNLKAYPIHRIVQSADGGWLKARIWVELPLWRAFEREWFEYMKDMPLVIQDVTPDAALEQPIRLHVTDVLFTRKWTLMSVDVDSEPKREESFVAVVSAEESLIQWLARNWLRLIEHVWIRLVIPLVFTVGAGLVPVVVQHRRDFS